MRSSQKVRGRSSLPRPEGRNGFVAAHIKTPDDPVVPRVRPRQPAHNPGRAKGRLSPDHIHELNQPLTAVANYINAARRWLKLPDGSRKAAPLLDKAAEQMSRAGNLIQHLRCLGNDATGETMTSRIGDAHPDR